MRVSGTASRRLTATIAKSVSIFVPVLALRAYRVADAEHGWYFIGREPLSGFARMWNVLVLAAVAAVVAWNT